MAKRWVKGPALELMLKDAGPKHAIGVFQPGDEVLLRTGQVGVLVKRKINNGYGLRIETPSIELWMYWDEVIGWRRP